MNGECLMVYIVVLNWNGWRDTIACVESLMFLDYRSYKIVICDNDSSDDSVDKILTWYDENKEQFEYLKQAEFTYLKGKSIDFHESTSQKGLFLLQTGKNLGYAGGNNVGIRFAMAQHDMSYAWILNNDTAVAKNALAPLVNKCKNNKNIAVCGSRMIYFDERTKQQGLGGVFNKYLATTKHFEANVNPNTKYDDSHISKKIDYIIGAAMFITKNALNNIGLLREDYFLYFEELDYAIRTKNKGYALEVVSDSFVYHKEGATMKREVSHFSDFLQVKNRLKISKRFFKQYYIIVWFSLFGVFLNRLIRKDFRQAYRVLTIIIFRDKAEFK
jgi:GT2 family glycosyltransferase